MATKVLNGNLGMWLKLSLTIAVLLVGIAIAYGKISNEQESHCVRIGAVEERTRNQDATISAQNTSIGRVEAQVEYIKDTVDEINSVQREILRELKNE